MFTPRYSISNKVLKNLTTLERLYGQIESEELIPSIALRLQNQNLVLSTHHSTSIEGNPLSPTEVTNIILGDKIPTTRAEQEVKDYFEALVKLDEFKRQNSKIDIAFINKLHSLAMKSVGDKRIGEFRNSRVVVGHKETIEEGTTIQIKHEPPAHTKSQIIKLMQDLLVWLNSDETIPVILKAGIFHHRFVYIHPFYDGNGRVTRLLTAYFLMQNGYEVTRYFILDDYYNIDRFEYSDKLHTADDGDHTKWLEYFTEGLVYSLQASIAKIREYKEESLEEIKGEKRALVTKREEDVLRIVMNLKAVRSRDIVNKLSVSRQQAFRLLNSLVKKRILKKKGKTKSSYYEIKK